MANPPGKVEALLHELGRRMHLGAGRLYPATEQHLDIVRQIVREQWTQEQQQLAQSPPAKQRAPRRKRARARPQAKAKLKRTTRRTRRQQPIKQIPPPTQRHGY